MASLINSGSVEKSCSMVDFFLRIEQMQVYFSLHTMNLIQFSVTPYLNSRMRVMECALMLLFVCVSPDQTVISLSVRTMSISHVCPQH